MITKISTIGMTRAEWLEQRGGTIGGSDAGAICGMNPYSSPYSVFAEKRKLIPPKEENEAMRQGRDLEQYVAQRFAEETGKKVRRDNSIIYNSDYPFAHADLDRVVVGEDAGLECKTASPMNYAMYADGNYPEHYYVQCMHYMMVTGKSKWYLAVLVFQRGLFIFEINRDEAEIATLAEVEKAFYENNIKAGIEPPPDGSEATTNALAERFPDSMDIKLDLTPCAAQIAMYLSLKEQEKATKALIEEAANAIKAYMKDAERGEYGDHKVIWKNSKRSTFDKKRLAAEHPEINLDDYTNQTQSRKFTIS